MLWRFAPMIVSVIAVSVASQSPPTISSIDENLVRNGLVAWNKPDSGGRACVGCHSPQGLEVAFYNFSDEDILRRARAHVTDQDAHSILAMIHARRRQYKLFKLLDPLLDRPLQPGGKVLSGDTPLQRDQAFLLELDRKIPILTRGSVNSIGKARDVVKQVLSLNLQRLRVGIEFNRLSEDGFHGAEHASLANWIPDLPIELSDVGLRQRTAYQIDPSLKNFEAYFSSLSEAPVRGTSIGYKLAVNKYKSLLKLQQQLVHPEHNAIRPILHFDNPFWDVAELARNAQGVGLRQLGLPDDIRTKKEPGPPMFQQFKSMKLPWYWISWIADPGLQYTNSNRKAVRGDFFAFTLFEDGPYPTHCAFMYLRHQFSHSFDPASWNATSPQHFVMDFGVFLMNNNFKRFIPQDPQAAALYQRFVMNSFRASLLILLDEAKTSHLSDLKFPALAQSRQMADFIEEQDPKSKLETERLLAQITKAFSNAREVTG